MALNKKTIVFSIIILLALVLAIFFVVKNQDQAEEGIFGNQDKTSQPEGAVTVVNEEDYRRELKQALDSLMTDPDNPAVVNSAKERILDLSVPGKYRQLHLDIVLAIAHLENNNGTIEKLAEIISNNEWLK